MRTVLRAMASILLLQLLGLTLYDMPTYSGGSQEDFTTECLDIAINLIDLRETKLSGSDETSSGWHTWIQAGYPPNTDIGVTCGGQWVLGRHKHSLTNAVRDLRAKGYTTMDLHTSSVGWLIRANNKEDW